MDYAVQTNALVPYCLLAAIYMGILFFSKVNRDRAGFLLVAGFCLALGLRDMELMNICADPVIYAKILSNSLDLSAFAGGVDYVLFTLLHPITGAFLDETSCFLALHLLYIPLIYILYRSIRHIKGAFFLMAGWFLFVNSGLLLIANFFRQGMSVILFLCLSIALSTPSKNMRAKRLCTGIIPFLHVAAAGFIPGMLLCRKRLYYLYSSFSFVLVCALVHWAPASISAHFSNYYGNAPQELKQAQMWIKLLGIYSILGIGYFIHSRLPGNEAEESVIERTAIGFLLPTAALALTISEPTIGLRFLYYSYAMVFLYLSCVIGRAKRESLLKLAALATCLFGLITWTYPTVTCLLWW